MTDDDTAEPFNVSILPPALAQFRRWSELSIRLGRRSDFLDAMGHTLHRLDHVPITWGDPLSGYDRPSAVEYRGMIPGWWLVWYAVDEGAKRVVVRSLLPAPGSPLTVEDDPT
jgi:hypothetical protein